MGVVDDVRSYLQASDLVDGSTGWLSVPRVVHDEQDQLVVLSEDGGPPPEIAKPSGLGDGASQFAGLQVRVRAAAYEHDVAYAKAREIMDALHSLTAAVLGSTTYEGVWALTSEPVLMGFDDTGRPEYTQSFRLMSPVPV
jgi:hypothetical protein